MDKQERNIAIAAARESGRTLSDIGQEFGLSRETIRMIVARVRRQNTAKVRRTEVYPGLSERTAKALACANLTMQEALQLTNAELLRIPNFGRLALNELRGRANPSSWT